MEFPGGGGARLRESDRQWQIESQLILIVFHDAARLGSIHCYATQRIHVVRLKITARSAFADNA